MNQEFKNSTCSESTLARYENEIPLRHHLVKENKYIYYLGKQERMKLERVNPACRPYSQGFITIITGKTGNHVYKYLEDEPYVWGVTLLQFILSWSEIVLLLLLR